MEPQNAIYPESRKPDMLFSGGCCPNNIWLFFLPSMVVGAICAQVQLNHTELAIRVARISWENRWDGPQERFWGSNPDISRGRMDQCHQATPQSRCSGHAFFGFIVQLGRWTKNPGGLAMPISLRVLVLATAATEKSSRSWTEINPGLIFMLPPMWYTHKHMHGPPHTNTHTLGWY